jgi:pimeloyl-ACP methyl ester carboxylesterase
MSVRVTVWPATRGFLVGYLRWRGGRSVTGAAMMALASVALAPSFALAVEAPARVAVPTLTWGPCPPQSDAALAGFVCASAAVPFDYSDPSSGTIELAVVKHPATDPAHRIGTLFMNPGGPGGQGTTQITGALPLVPEVLRERFDVVSWDPRGVGGDPRGIAPSPGAAVQCFASQAAEGEFLGEFANFPVGHRQKQGYISTWRRFGEICARRVGDLLSHVSTAETARDLDLLRQAVGDQALIYWGESYGTLLGATYANLFADKVRALVLDGNVAPSAWTNAGERKVTQTISQRIGTDVSNDVTLSAMVDLCGQAPVDKCAFSAGGAAATHAKFDALLARLRQGPITIEFGGHTLRIDYAFFLTVLSEGLDIVQPFVNEDVPAASFGGWPLLMNVAQALWDNRDNPGELPTAPSASQPTTETYAGPEQSLAVLCGDAPTPTLGEFRRLARQQPERTGPIGEVILWGDEPCVTWPARSPAAYEGPWNTPTSAPILVIGNTTDPSTPLPNSLKMAAELADARLLIVKGYGHTEINNPSTCASDAVVSYVVNRVLPPTGTICAQDAAPFQ